MLILQKNLKFTLNIEKLCAVKRCLSIKVKVSEQLNQNNYENFEDEWKNAKSFDKIPAPTKFSFFRRFLPGGKYHNKKMSEVLNMMKDEYGPISIIPGMFGKENMLVSFSPKDYEKIFRTEGIWPKRMNLDSISYFRNVEKADFYKNSTGVGVEQGESWGKTRSIVNPVLMQPRTVTQYIPALDIISTEFIEKIKDVRDSKNFEVPSNFDSEVHRWVMESMGVLSLDTRLGLIKDFGKNPISKKLAENMTRFFQLLNELEIKPNFSKYFSTPTFKEMMKVQTELLQVASNYVEETIKDLKNRPEKSVHEKSILERLLDIDKHLAVVTASDMLVFGVDTTSSAFISCLYHIARNPDKQNILLNELKEILPTKHSPLTERNMKNLPYLRACIKEALRINPVALGNSRTTNAGLVLSGYQVPKNTIVLMASEILQREDENFPQADKFIPERWLRDQTNNLECPAAAKSAHPFIFLPFGFGPRICVGKRIAQLELEIGLAKIFRNFAVEYKYPDLVYESHFINVPTGDFKFKMVDIKT